MISKMTDEEMDALIKKLDPNVIILVRSIVIAFEEKVEMVRAEFKELELAFKILSLDPHAVGFNKGRKAH